VGGVWVSVRRSCDAHVRAHPSYRRHWLTTPSKLSFSSAAATRSLSLSCLLMASSEACLPGVIIMSTFRRGGRERSSLTRKHRPMSVAIEQCGMVGVKRTTTRPAASSTSISWRCATLSCSSVCGCSGSLIPRISSAVQGTRDQPAALYVRWHMLGRPRAPKISSESIASRASGSLSVAYSCAVRRSSLCACSSGAAFSPSDIARRQERDRHRHRGLDTR